MIVSVRDVDTEVDTVAVNDTDSIDLIGRSGTTVVVCW